MIETGLSNSIFIDEKNFPILDSNVAGDGKLNEKQMSEIEAAVQNAKEPKISEGLESALKSTRIDRQQSPFNTPYNSSRYDDKFSYIAYPPEQFFAIFKPKLSEAQTLEAKGVADKVGELNDSQIELLVRESSDEMQLKLLTGLLRMQLFKLLRMTDEPAQAISTLRQMLLEIKKGGLSKQPKEGVYQYLLRKMKETEKLNVPFKRTSLSTASNDISPTSASSFPEPAVKIGSENARINDSNGGANY